MIHKIGNDVKTHKLDQRDCGDTQSLTEGLVSETTHHKWSPATLVLAVDDIKEGKILLRQAAIIMTSLQFLEDKNQEEEDERCEKN